MINVDSDARIEQYRSFESLFVQQKPDNPLTDRYIITCDFCGDCVGKGHSSLHAKFVAVQQGTQTFKLMARGDHINICDMCARNSVQEIIDWPFK